MSESPESGSKAPMSPVERQGAADLTASGEPQGKEPDDTRGRGGDRVAPTSSSEPPHVQCDCHPGVRWTTATWGQECPISCAERERDAALARAERLEVQLAGCGVAAIQNTRETWTAGELPPDAYGFSASYADVRAAVLREMDARERAVGAEVAVLAVDDWWANNWDCSASPGHSGYPDMAALVAEIRSRVKP